MKLRIPIIITAVGVLITAAFEMCYAWVPAQGMMFLAGFIRVAFLVLFVAAVVWVFTLWWAHKVRALIPFVLVLLFMFGGCDAANRVGQFLGKQRFLERLPRFEEAVWAIRSGAALSNSLFTVRDLPHGRQWVAIHRSGPYIGYAAVTDPETNGSLTIRFLQDVTFNSHHREFVFQSEGDFKGALSEREFILYEINTNWCAVAD